MKTLATVLLAGLLSAPAVQAQLGGIKLNSRLDQATKDAVGMATLSDAQIQGYAKQSVTWMDEHNAVAGPNDPYTIRLTKVFGKHVAEDDLKLNFKVYKVTDVNAFACADGSVRVFSALMDMMTDDELLGIIGHEIGHVKNSDTKDAMKSALKRSAIKNLAASQSSTVNQLARSELGALGENIINASYSRKQESEADEYSYNFMKKHGYNVIGLATAFEKLDKLSEGAKKGTVDKLMSSHPDSAKRAKAVHDRAKKDGLEK
ncbi:MAG: M48 family metallopeptidase [Bacteroidetes bacterium]|nr:M48 family metallopeptidase [Fibrella sp.]